MSNVNLPPTGLYCSCGQSAPKGARFCSHCGQQLAWRGIRREFHDFCRSICREIQLDINSPKTLQELQVDDSFQPGEEIFGQFEFDEFEDWSPEELTQLNDYLAREMPKRELSELTPHQREILSNHPESRLDTVATFSVYRLAVNRLTPKYHHTMAKVIWVVFTSHRLYLLTEGGGWSIWWSRVQGVRTQRDVSPLDPETEVVTLVFTYTFEPWSDLADDEENPEQGQGQFLLGFIESGAAQLFQELNGLESPFEKWVRFLGNIPESLVPA